LKRGKPPSNRGVLNRDQNKTKKKAGKKLKKKKKGKKEAPKNNPCFLHTAKGFRGEGEKRSAEKKK